MRPNDVDNHDEMNRDEVITKGNKKRNGKKGRSKSRSKDMSVSHKLSEACNDLSWYAQYPELVNASASFPYSWPLGNVVRQFTDSSYDMRLPGMMAIDVMLTPGISRSANSPITLAARNLYSWIRHDNSGAKNYEATDLIMYVLAMDNAYAMYAYLCRAYVYMTTINPENRYYPKQIVEAMGFDYENLHGNLAQLEYIIEQYRVKLQKCSMPSHLPLFERHRWLFSSVYTDSSTSKAQTYFFRPTGFHYWVEGEGTTLGELRYQTRAGISDKWTLANIQSVINTIMTPILGSDDFNTIAGDIRKSFAGDVYIVEPMSAFIKPPTYDAEVLSQIENLSFVNIVTDTCKITQDASINAGYIIFDPECTAGAPDSITRLVVTRKRLITMDLNDPKPGDTMIATRLTNIPSMPGSTANRMKFEHTGSELVTSLTMYRMSTDDANVLEFNAITTDAQMLPSSDTVSPVYTLDAIASLSKFDKHPSVCLCQEGSTPEFKWIRDMKEVDKYTILSADDLSRMHDAAIISELSWPQIRF